MATILNNTYTDGDLVLGMTNEQIARTISVGNSWNRIRIGIRFAIPATVSSLVTPNFAWGICSGTGSLYADANTSHFIGTDIQSGLTFANSSNTFYRLDNAAGKRFVVKTNSTAATFWSASYWFPCYVSASTFPDRHVEFIDIVKANTDPGRWLINFVYFTPSGYIWNDVTSQSFYSNITNDTASLDSTMTLATFTVPVSESVNGYLDTVNVYWNKTTPALEISDIAVYRLA